MKNTYVKKTLNKKTESATAKLWHKLIDCLCRYLYVSSVLESKQVPAGCPTPSGPIRYGNDAGSQNAQTIRSSNIHTALIDGNGRAVTESSLQERHRRTETSCVKGSMITPPCSPKAVWKREVRRRSCEFKWQENAGAKTAPFEPWQPYCFWLRLDRNALKGRAQRSVGTGM